ncbi:nucleoside diphosphate kinase 6-like [Anneissia japonica]|uniref:nucleoside diphosphate kinase 6-like n=1 Tax=Anneissia japonica TaxID=1529436 RepID=UPI00142578F0|nr:nucleoside diphosphate kinase 6-like [Anneissia japonica]
MGSLGSLRSSVVKLELTLAVIKPDIVAHPHRHYAIKDIILSNNFYFIRSKVLKWNRDRAQEFYREHKGKFFYNRLVEFMSSGPMSAHILAREGAIAHWRKLMGPTKTFQARHKMTDSIRGTYGLTDTRNATHGSDSPESARKEIAFFYPDFNVDHWYKRQEHLYRTQNVVYCKETGLHKPQGTDS